MTQTTIALVATAASPSRHLATLVAGLHGHGWNVQVQVTETARTLFEADWPPELNMSAGICPDLRPDLVLVAPATFHWIAALAAGLNDTASLQIVHRSLGSVPVYVFPHVDQRLAANPLLARNLRLLTEAGVNLVVTAVCDGGCGLDAHWPQAMEAIGRRF